MGRLAAISAVLTLAVTSCGSDTVVRNEAPEASTAIENAEPTTETTETEAPDDGPTSSPDELLAAIEATIGLALRGELRTEISDAPGDDPLAVGFEVDADGDTNVSLLPGPGAPQVSIRNVGGQLYYGIPAEFAAALYPGFSQGTGWFTVSPESAAADEFGFVCVTPLLGLSAEVQECDPEADLRQLADAAENGTVVGSEEIFGVSATRLSYNVPLASLPSVSSSSGAFPIPEGIEGALNADIALEAWIDDKNLLRRMVLDLSSVFQAIAETFGDDGQTPETPTFKTIIEYHEFDESISIEAPAPESLLGDYQEFIEAAGP